MHIDEFGKNVIITAERGNYLAIKDLDNSEEVIGRPLRLILSTSGRIPEFQDVPLRDELVNEKFEVVQEEQVEEKKATKSKSKK